MCTQWSAYAENVSIVSHASQEVVNAAINLLVICFIKRKYLPNICKKNGQSMHLHMELTLNGTVLPVKPSIITYVIATLDNPCLYSTKETKKNCFAVSALCLDKLIVCHSFR